MTIASITQLPGEPIFVCVYEGEITAADIFDTYQTTGRLWKDELKTSGSHVITDLRQITNITFVETMKSLQVTHEQEKVFASMMPYVHFYAVGSNVMAKLYVSSRRLPQFGGVTIPLFARYEDALDAARMAIIKKGETLPTDEA